MQPLGAMFKDQGCLLRLTLPLEFHDIYRFTTMMARYKIAAVAAFVFAQLLGPASAVVPSGVGNNVVSTAVSKFASAALRKYYSNSSDQYEFSAVSNIVHHKDGRITGDMVMSYKKSDLTVRLNITLDKKNLTIRNAWGHVMGVYPIADEPEETPQ